MFGMTSNHPGRQCFGAVVGVLATLTLAPTAPAKAAMTEVYYQRAFSLDCSGSACKLDLPKVAANTRLNITRVSCAMATASAHGGIVQFEYNANAAPVKQYLAPIQVSQLVALFNQDMDILVPAQKVVGITLFSGLSASSASCTLTGRLQ
jgi:hypothetical protein